MPLADVAHQTDAGGRGQQEDAAEEDHVKRRVGVPLTKGETNHRPEADRGDDLRNDDEEVEHAHVHAHSLRGERRGEYGVWHRENRRPGDADPDHAEQQHAPVVDEIHREQA